MIASLIYQCVPVPCDSQRSLERNRSVTHTIGRGNRRQEGRERGYYNLHRNLNETLFHGPILFTLHSSLFTRAALVFIQSFAAIATFTADTRADHEGRSLSGHSEATGVDTVVLSQLDSRTVD